MNTIIQDLRYGLRMLAKNPGFTAVAVMTLALGIGANTAIFSVVNAVLLRPLPFEDPSRLMMLWEGVPQLGWPKVTCAAPDLTLYEREQKSFEAVGAFRNQHYELSGSGTPERLMGARVSASLFPLLGISPLVGRDFTANEDRPGSNVVMLSYGLWQRRFGGDPAIVGKTIDLDRVPYAIVGVMPRSFVFPIPGPESNSEPAAFWVPMAFTQDELTAWGNMMNHSVVARLRPGVTPAAAQGEAESLAPRIQERYPASTLQELQGAKLSLTLTPYHDEVVGDVRTLLLVLLAAVGLVLLIACANVATLLLSRAAARHREVAIRSALGAGRGRLVRQLLSESLILGLAGGGLGWLVAFWSEAGFLSLLPASIPLPHDVTMGGPVFFFALALSVLACLFFGTAPALLISRTDLRSALQEGGRSASASRRGRRMQAIFATAEVGLALVLVVGAGLLAKSFVRLLQVNPGFRPDHVLSMWAPLPARAYPKASEVRSFYQKVLDRVTSMAGVEAAGVSSDLPLNFDETDTIEIEGRKEGTQSTAPVINQTWALGDYFRAMGIPLVRGRWFTPDDREGTMPVAVVSETMARDFWPGEDPVGKRIRWGGVMSGPWRTIVGIVGDVKDSSLSAVPLPHTYTPYSQEKDELFKGDTIGGELRSMRVSVRTKAEPAAMARVVEGAIHSLDPDLAISEVRTMQQDIQSSLAPQRFNMFLLGVFAGLALFLAMIGIYGVLAYAVAQETHDIGVRMALGAGRGEVLQMVLRNALALVLPGMAVGLVGALVLTRFLSSLLFGVRPSDPTTFAAVSVLLAAVALLASYIPARRATKVDPMVALRYE
jgi:putative ABC transport system permease protein